jgi:tetratricopeptide (TPR) repeat protein
VSRPPGRGSGPRTAFGRGRAGTVAALAAGFAALAVAAVPGAAPARAARPAIAAGAPSIASADVAQLLLNRGPDSTAVRAIARPHLRGAPAAPLDADRGRRLREAAALREQGRLAEARAILDRLAFEVPHHPLVTAERMRVQLARQDWMGAERLARAERLAAKDSLLLARELVLAFERQGRSRDMAQVAVEAWVASPGEQDWAISVLDRASAGDARAARDALRRATQQRPERVDLARHAARLEWRGGDAKLGLRMLAAAEHAQGRSRLRWAFAEELLMARAPADTTGAIEVLFDLAADVAVDPAFRTAAAHRAWDALAARGAEHDAAPRVSKAIGDVPPARWSAELRLGVARALRARGRTGEARALLETADRRAEPREFALERALADLRDGPPARALPALRRLADESPGNAYHYGEALFFDGRLDSAHAWFQTAAGDPAAPLAGAALERLYLLEEEGNPPALAALGRVAYAEWRGDRASAEAIADSLWRALPEGPLWAQAAVTLAHMRAGGPAPATALEPLLAVAERHPEDRLAPLARQLAGDLYLDRLKDEAGALAQYEECLARYPRAWNAPDVRRKLETLRRERRF